MTMDGDRASDRLDRPTFSRRGFLRSGALTVAGATGLTSLSVGEAQACMECLTEKLDGKYPIGKTVVVGNQVVPVGSTGRCGIRPGSFQSGEHVEMDPAKFLTTFDYGKATQQADGTYAAGILVCGRRQGTRSRGRNQISGLDLQRLHARPDAPRDRRRPAAHPF